MSLSNNFFCLCNRGRDYLCNRERDYLCNRGRGLGIYKAKVQILKFSFTSTTGRLWCNMISFVIKGGVSNAFWWWAILSMTSSQHCRQNRDRIKGTLITASKQTANWYTMQLVLMVDQKYPTPLLDHTLETYNYNLQSFLIHRSNISHNRANKMRSVINNRNLIRTTTKPVTID